MATPPSQQPIGRVTLTPPTGHRPVSSGAMGAVPSGYSGRPNQPVAAQPASPQSELAPQHKAPYGGTGSWGYDRIASMRSAVAEMGDLEGTELGGRLRSYLNENLNPDNAGDIGAPVGARANNSAVWPGHRPVSGGPVGAVPSGYSGRPNQPVAAQPASPQAELAPQYKAPYGGGAMGAVPGGALGRPNQPVAAQPASPQSESVSHIEAPLAPPMAAREVGDRALTAIGRKAFAAQLSSPTGFYGGQDKVVAPLTAKAGMNRGDALAAFGALGQKPPADLFSPVDFIQADLLGSRGQGLPGITRNLGFRDLGVDPQRFRLHGGQLNTFR